MKMSPATRIRPAGTWRSYVGHDEPALASRAEPYSLYNSDGLDRSKNETATLLDSLGMELPEGNYSFSFNQSTMFSCGSKKVYYGVIDETTGEEIAHLDVDKPMVDATVGSDSGAFEIRTVPFTIDASRAGHKITFMVAVYNQTDYLLKSATLNMIVDADAQAPADAQGVIDAIASLDITDAEAIANARTAYEALDIIGKAWVGAELAAKLASYEQAQDSAKAVVDAIAALGDKDDLTDENYTDKTEALTAAEKLYNDFVRLYGEEDSAKLITNAQALTDYRTAYNAAEEAAKAKAKQAAIQNVEDLIEAIGEVNEDNYTEKEALIVAAETALRELQATYGDEAANEVRNKGDLEEAREKYDEIVAEPEVTYGDMGARGTQRSTRATR